MREQAVNKLTQDLRASENVVKQSLEVDHEYQSMIAQKTNLEESADLSYAEGLSDAEDLSS